MFLNVSQVRPVERSSQPALLPVCFLLVLLLVSFSHAQQRWTRTYGGPNDDVCRMAQQTSDGGYIAVGKTNTSAQDHWSYYLIKTDAAGDTIWTRTYTGSNVDNRGDCVQQTSDGGYIISGTSLIPPPETSHMGARGDIYVIKTDASGAPTWSNSYAGANDHVGYEVSQTSDGGYIVSGSTDMLGADSFDLCLIKTDSSGNALWTRTYGGTSDEEGGYAHQTSDGGYFITGSTTSFGDTLGDVYFVKTSATGDTLWTRTYGRGFCFSAQQTSDGGYIIPVTTIPFRGVSDARLIKTNASGDTMWTKTYGDTGDDWATSALQTSDAGYILGGFTSSFGAGSYDVWLIKTNASGVTLWTRTYGGAGDDEGGVSQQTSDGGYILPAYTNSFGAGGYDFYLIKTDAHGSAGVEEQSGQGRTVKGQGYAVTPNPFSSFARIPGHEGERFNLYDISGKCVGAARGDRLGEKLSPGVYFVSPDEAHGKSVRIVKVR